MELFSLAIQVKTGDGIAKEKINFPKVVGRQDNIPEHKILGKKHTIYHKDPYF